jgi:hypothetical protein
MKTIKYVIATALLSVGTLLATIPFNAFSPIAGTGFVSEADIRTAFNWQTLNTPRANSLSYSVYTNDRYACVCSTAGGNFNQWRSVRAYKLPFDSAAFSGNQITGMNLTGYYYIASDQVPYVGQNCNQSYWYGTFSSVTLATQDTRLYMTTNASTSQPASQMIWQQISP